MLSTTTYAGPAHRTGSYALTLRPDVTASLHQSLQAGFPTVEQLGLFKLNSWPAPIWLYQVLETTSVEETSTLQCHLSCSQTIHSSCMAEHGHPQKAKQFSVNGQEALPTQVKALLLPSSSA
jgi:hypothetical protein